MTGSTVGQQQGSSASSHPTVSTTPTMVLPPPPPKIPKAEKFDGTRDKLESFLVRMDMDTTIYSRTLGGEEGKIIYVVSYFEKAALKWVQPAIAQYYNETDREDG